MREMARDGVELSGVNCNCVLASPCKEEKVREARLVYGWMRKAGMAVGIGSGTCFIDLLCQEKLTVETRKLFDEMAEKGVSPNVVTCPYFDSWVFL